jgi:hypothetical protein
MELRKLIVERDIKELLVVFLTDGDNKDKIETKDASDHLYKVLQKINSKFNVIGFGDDFNVGILNDLIKAGSEQGVVGIVSSESTNEDLSDIFKDIES